MHRGGLRSCGNELGDTGGSLNVAAHSARTKRKRGQKKRRGQDIIASKPDPPLPLKKGKSGVKKGGKMALLGEKEVTVHCHNRKEFKTSGKNKKDTHRGGGISATNGTAPLKIKKEGVKDSKDLDE